MSQFELEHKFVDGRYLYRDELSEVEVWVPKSKFITYIKDTYHILPEEYYNLVMVNRGIDSFNRCKVCGNVTKFINIFKGYRDTCSVTCRNRLISRGNPELIIVTKRGSITHVVNQESLTKFKVDKEIQDLIPKDINLIQLIQFLTNNDCLWISGYNINSIKYASDELKYLRLKSIL